MDATFLHFELGNNDGDRRVRLICKPQGHQPFLSLDNGQMDIDVSLAQGCDRFIQTHERISVETLKTLSDLIHPHDRERGLPWPGRLQEPALRIFEKPQRLGRD